VRERCAQLRGDFLGEQQAERGYSITTDAAGTVLRDASKVRDGERLHTRLARGTLDSEVKKT
jgi:exonuclease VII large subunit